jgi:hypothetical protein
MENKICARCGMEYPNHKMSCKIPVEEWRLPTAVEFFDNLYPSAHTEHCDIEKAMVEFAKLHCETQLKAILENAKTKTEEDYLPREGEYVYTQVIDKDSILNAYPLDLIK